MTNPKQGLIRNIFSNWASMAVSVIIGFFISPFLVHSLGKEIYGIFALASSVIIYTEFLDAGMRQALARYLPKFYASKDYENINVTLNSSTFVYTIISTAIIAATLIIAFNFLHIFNLGPENSLLLRDTLIILGITQAINFLFMAFIALGPFHRYDIPNGIAITGAILRAVGIVYFLNRGYGIVAIATIALVIKILSIFAARIFQQKIVPQIRIGFRYIKKENIKMLLGYGIISFLIVGLTLVIFYTDNIIIGIYLSATSVAYYSIANNLITQLRMLINAIGVPMVPAISHLDTTSDMNEISDLYQKVSKYLFYLVSCICLGIFFWGENFIILWMGEGFDQSVIVLLILIVPALFYLPQIVANSILLGISKHHILLYILIAEAISNIVLSIILVQTMGIYGVALGTAIPQFIIYVFIYPYTFMSTIKGNLRKFYIESSKMILIALILTGPINYLTNKFVYFGNWFSFFADIIFVGIITLLGFYIFILSDSDKRRVIGMFGR